MALSGCREVGSKGGQLVATITVTDRKDGTGADALLGSVSGTATVYTSRFDGDFTDAAFVSRGSRTDAGAVTLASGLGSYFAVVIDDSGSSVPVAYRVSDGSIGTHEDVHRAIREFVLSMNLAAFPSNGLVHHIHKRPYNTFQELQAAGGEQVKGVHYWKRPESRTQSDNSRQQVIYPIELVLVQSNDLEEVGEADWTHSRQTLCQALSVGYPLPALPCVQRIDITPGEIYADTGSVSDIDAQALLFNCVVEELSVLQ